MYENWRVPLFLIPFPSWRQQMKLLWCSGRRIHGGRRRGHASNISTEEVFWGCFLCGVSRSEFRTTNAGALLHQFRSSMYWMKEKLILIEGCHVTLLSFAILERYFMGGRYGIEECGSRTSCHFKFYETGSCRRKDRWQQNGSSSISEHKFECKFLMFWLLVAKRK